MVFLILLLKVECYHFRNKFFLLYWFKVRQMDELEKNERLGDLFAYYGPLLTKGQQEYF